MQKKYFYLLKDILKCRTTCQIIKEDNFQTEYGSLIRINFKKITILVNTLLEHQFEQCVDKIMNEREIHSNDEELWCSCVDKVWGVFIKSKFILCKCTLITIHFRWVRQVTLSCQANEKEEVLRKHILRNTRGIKRAFKS